MIERERLHHEVRGPALDGGHRVLDRAVSGDHHGDDFRIAFERGLDHRRAVDAWQPQVGDDDVEGELGQQVPRGFSALGLHHAVAMLGQPLGGRLPERRLVLDEEQMYFVCGHVGADPPGPSVGTLTPWVRNGQDSA